MNSPVAGDGKIKILRVIGRLNVGGAAIHVVNLCAGFNPARFDQLLVVGSENPAEGSMLDYALARGVHPYVIPEIVTAFSLTPRDETASCVQLSSIKRGIFALRIELYLPVGAGIYLVYVRI
jgi:hypothetical protein